MSDFTTFRNLVRKVQKQTGQCDESLKDFEQCSTIPQLVQVWKKYWSNLLDEAPTQLLQMFDRHYEKYADGINAAGVYYNEAAPHAMCLIGDMPETFLGEPLEVNSEAIPTHVYVLGRARVTLRGVTRAYVNNPAAVIELKDITSANVVAGHAIARDRSRLTTAGSFERYNAAVVTSTRR